MDTDFHKIVKDNEIINPDQEILIGNHCWIGMNVSILKGSVIPDNCVIAACSTITRKLNLSNCIYLNNSIIKEDITWKM